MKFRRFLVCFFCIFLYGCDSSGSSGQAVTLSDPAMSAQVDPETQEPVQPAQVFTPQTATLYATIKLSHAPAETPVTARFYFGEQDKQKIAEDTVTTGGTGYLGFSLNPPASGWPIGAYQVEFYLGDDLKQSLSFSVQEKNGSATPVAGSAVLSSSNPQGAPSSEGIQYKLFTEKQFGFSLELPADWNFRVTGEHGDYLFSGPAGTDQGEIAIIIQMIDTRRPPHSTLKGEMENLFTIFTRQPNTKVVKQDSIDVAGTSAPFFLVTYLAKNGQGKTVPWGHTQLGLQNGPIVLLVSYAAPREIYQQNINIFQHMVDTFSLTPPAS